MYKAEVKSKYSAVTIFIYTSITYTAIIIPSIGKSQYHYKSVLISIIIHVSVLYFSKQIFMFKRKYK